MSCWTTARVARAAMLTIAMIIIVGFGLGGYMALRKEPTGFLIASETSQIGRGESVFFEKKCRYLTLRGVFEQVGAEESLWRLERYSCPLLMK